jgi:hypothetical protein
MAAQDYWARPPITRTNRALCADARQHDRPMRPCDSSTRCSAARWTAGSTLRWAARTTATIRRHSPAILYGLCHGTISRKLEYACRYNMDFIWLIEGAIDHNVRSFA